MKRMAFLAAIAILSWGRPALGGSQHSPFCMDGVSYLLDNCVVACNTNQDDTDHDDCGNLCDADYDNNGVVGFPDFGAFVGAFGGTNEEFCHNEPIPGCIVGFPDFGFMVSQYGQMPGPSSTTAGTTACP
jgi:hypothetical protein